MTKRNELNAQTQHLLLFNQIILLISDFKITKMTQSFQFRAARILCLPETFARPKAWQLLKYIITRVITLFSKQKTSE